MRFKEKVGSKHADSSNGYREPTCAAWILDDRPLSCWFCDRTWTLWRKYRYVKPVTPKSPMTLISSIFWTLVPIYETGTSSTEGSNSTGFLLYPVVFYLIFDRQKSYNIIHKGNNSAAFSRSQVSRNYQTCASVPIYYCDIPQSETWTTNKGNCSLDYMTIFSIERCDGDGLAYLRNRESQDFRQFTNSSCSSYANSNLTSHQTSLKVVANMSNS